MADSSRSSSTDLHRDPEPRLGLVERVAALHRVDLFADVPGRVLAAVAAAAEEVRAEPGALLIEAGAVEAHLYAVVEGRVRVHRGEQTLIELGPGATVGELAALVPRPRAASVTALEPLLALRVDQPELHDLLAAWPELTDGDRRARGAPARRSRPRGRRAVTDASPRGVLGLLTAQALAFGVSLALLIVPANSIFLDAYGSEWLPVTYIAIAIAGTAVASLIARAARRDAAGQRGDRLARRPRHALRGLVGAPGGGRGVGLGPAAVMFPVARQIGFVFIGGQAGRLLDVLQMKAFFPRVMSGFALGFLLGGLLGVPLLALLGSTEALLLATAAAQLAFLGGLLLTERRHPEVRRPGGSAGSAGAPVARPPLRSLVVGLVALLFAYQLLAAGTAQIVSFLFFDRAGARHSGEDLTRYSGFTAVLNLVDVLFLALLRAAHAPLRPAARAHAEPGGRGRAARDHGRRRGRAGRRVVRRVCAGGAAAHRQRHGDRRHDADVDGTSSPTSSSTTKSGSRSRRSVEGIGVPVAIGATGVLLLLIDAAGLGVEGVIVVGLALAALWWAVALAVHRSYAHSLAGEIRGWPLAAADLGGEESAMRALLRSDDARDVRLGLDLLAGEFRRRRWPSCGGSPSTAIPSCGCGRSPDSSRAATRGRRPRRRPRRRATSRSRATSPAGGPLRRC